MADPRILVIGGSDAGIAAASRARELDPSVPATVVVADAFPNFSIGTGAVPVRPPIDGLDLPGVHVLHTMADTVALHHALTSGARSAIIVGGGHIGLGDGRGLHHRGLDVTLVEQAPAVMPTVDLELGRLLGEELRRHGVQVVNDVTVKAIHHEARGADRGRRT